MSTCSHLQGPLAVSALLERTGNWSLVFSSIALVNLGAAAAFCTLSTATPDPTLNTILVNSANFNSQPLPLSYCERWPLWMADSTGVALTLLPGFDEESEESGWCNPLTFEQL